MYWPDCGSTTVWRRELWEEVVERIHKNVPVLNLAAGSCYPMERQPERFENKEDLAYVKWLHGICKVTSVRDALALKLLEAADCKSQLIPCSAFVFANQMDATPEVNGPIIINYMAGGGHYDWNQKIDAAQWEKTIKDLIDRLQVRHRVVMLCHDKQEAQLAKNIAPSCERLLPNTYKEYISMVANAKVALCNRMHASVALAGMGIPSVAVCTDSRLLMVKQLGLPCFYVKDTSVDTIEAEIALLIRNRLAIASRLKSLQDSTFQGYRRLIQQYVS